MARASRPPFGFSPDGRRRRAVAAAAANLGAPHRARRSRATRRRCCGSTARRCASAAQSRRTRRRPARPGATAPDDVLVFARGDALRQRHQPLGMRRSRCPEHTAILLSSSPLDADCCPRTPRRGYEHSTSRRRASRNPATTRNAPPHDKPTHKHTRKEPTMRSPRTIAAVAAITIAGVGLLAGCSSSGGGDSSDGKVAHHRRQPDPRQRQVRIQGVRRPRQGVREGEPEHRHQVRGVPVDRADVRDAARRRHAARRLQRAVHRLAVAAAGRPARRHHRRGEQAAVRGQVQREHARRRQERRQDLRHPVRPVRHGPVVQPGHLPEGRPRPEQAADDLGRGPSGREDHLRRRSPVSPATCR